MRPELCTVAGHAAQYMAKIEPGLDDTDRLGGGLPAESANCLDRDGRNEPLGVRGRASIQQHPVRANPTQLTGYRQATGDHNAQPGAQCGAQAGVQSLPDQLRARSLLDLAGSFRALKLGSACASRSANRLSHRTPRPPSCREPSTALKHWP